MKEASIRPFSEKASIEDMVVEGRRHLFDVVPPVQGFELMLAHASLMDKALNAIFEDAVTATTKLPEEAEHIRRNLALVATGGYGRQELAPYSDVDVSFISTSDDDNLVGAAVKLAYENIVDILGSRLKLKLGYSYRLLGESEGLDLHTRTALLDSRCIAGAEEIAISFIREITDQLEARFVLDHVKARMDVSTIKPLYSVEPDVKNGIGALRDYHAAAWVSRAVLRCGRNAVWDEVVDRSVIPSDDIEALQEAVEFIRSVRNTLHLSAHRQLDVLPVDRRPEIASMLMMDEDSMLARYYESAEKVRSVCEQLWTVLSDKRLPVEKPFALVGRKVTLVDKASSLSRPGIALRAFTLAEDYDVPLSEELAGQISRVCRTTPPTFDDTENRFWFRSSLDGQSAGIRLSEMADLGLLQKLIPEFGKLMHKAPSDGSHELTVGAHSLLVAKTLDDMRRRQGILYGDLWGSVSKPAVLYFAALMHDIGKLSDGEEHASIGGRIAGELARKAGFSGNSAEIIQFLVTHHQTMAETARTHDLSNGSAAAGFASVVGDVSRLRMLFLLSAADVMSVGQASWAEMQCRFLEELYFEVEARIMGDVFAEPERVVNRRRKRLTQDLTLARLPEDVVREHIEVMPPEYLLNELPERVASHIEQVIGVRKKRPSVTFDEHPESCITDITVCAYDRHGLLSQITGVLHALDITVHSARVRTRSSTDAIAIDTLCVDFLGDRLPYFKRKEVEQYLIDVLMDRTSAEQIITARGKAFSSGPDIYSVLLTDAPHFERTVLQVRAEDVPGLLYHITSAIAHLGWSIQSAKITTIGRTAVDAFTVRSQGGGKLPRDAASRLKRVLTSEMDEVQAKAS